MTTLDYDQVLRCPACAEIGGILIPIRRRTNVVQCVACQKEYPIKEGVIDFLGRGYEERIGRAWYARLTRHEKWWKEQRTRISAAHATGSRWIASRKLIENYFALDGVDIAHHGLLLDVGCGDGARRNSFARKTYVGIDPLLLQTHYAFPFFRSVAEQLPFANATFDVATAVESLDHFADPARAIREILRCLAPGGALFLFVGNAGGCAEEHQSRQSRFAVTEDEVHTKSFSMTDLQELIGDAFAKLEIDAESEYLAAWGWNKK